MTDEKTGAGERGECAPKCMKPILLALSLRLLVPKTGVLFSQSVSGAACRRQQAESLRFRGLGQSPTLSTNCCWSPSWKSPKKQLAGSASRAPTLALGLGASLGTKRLLLVFSSRLTLWFSAPSLVISAAFGHMCEHTYAPRTHAPRLQLHPQKAREESPPNRRGSHT